MAKKTEPTEQKERISIVISREDKKHLGFIALERDLPSAGDAVSYILSHFDRSGKLKKKPETEVVVKGVDMSKIPEYAL